MNRKQLIIELNRLIDDLDEHINLFCKRIEFMRSGDKNKAKFIDERMLPIVDRKIQQQNERVHKLIYLKLKPYD
jgi:hypothetical protein